MNKTISILIALAALLWLATDAHSDNTKTLYTCGMHPQIILDHPGNCPICGMKLTPIRSISAGADTNAAASSAIAVDAATQQNMNIRTAVIQRGPLRKTIRTVGTIDYNETALADVTTHFKGWIVKLDVDATGQLVHRGDPLFEVHVPDIYDAEVQFLETVTNRFKNFNSVIVARNDAIRNLKNFDVSDAEIAQIETNRTVLKNLTVPAPISGFVIEKDAVQGQMVDAGIRLYRIADLGIVWVMAQVYEQDLAFVQLGQEAVVKIASLPDREFRGRVTFIYPTVDEKTRTARVRLEFENPGYFLKPGMFVTAQIQAELAGSAVLVPDEAVLRSGARNTVFVALAGGKFEARDVTLGLESENGLNQVTGGLSAGERVVTSGQFLLDSESQLREAIDKMNGPTTTTKMEMAGGQAANEVAAATPAKAEPETTVYVCPMPEHVSIIYDHAGNCPICGMALVPVTPSALKKIQPGGKVLYYTCPMPEHASVHEDKPGKCPLCAMTLIPVMEQPAIPTNSAARPAAKQLYTCPMHPEVISDKPGQCPKCGMDLMPVEK
jgi:RND family efflux transporter MFP subunit